MDHESIEASIRALLDDKNDIEDRIHAARHLGAAEDSASFEALARGMLRTRRR